MSAGYAQTTVSDNVALGVDRNLPDAAGRMDLAPSWCALMAPGMLLTRSIVTLTVIIAPWLSGFVYVAPGVRMIAAAMLLLHLLSTGFIVRTAQRRFAAYVFWTVLGIDAIAAGVALGANLQLRGPAVPLTLVVVAMSLEAGGGLALLLCTLATSAAAATAAWFEVAGPFVLSTALSFSPAMSLETYFAGAPASSAPGLPTTLSVETLYAGIPVLDRSAPLFVPALAIGLVALCVGGGMSLLHVRRNLLAVAATAVADEQVNT